MATTADIARITRRSEALKSLSLGEPVLLDPTPFERFAAMAEAVRKFNEQQKLRDQRLKNLLAESLIAARSTPP